MGVDRVRSRGGSRVGVVTVEEDVDLVNDGELRAAFAHALSGRPRLVVLDLHAAGMFGSTGLNALSWAYRRATANDVEVLVVFPSLLTAQALRVTGLDPLPGLQVIARPAAPAGPTGHIDQPSRRPSNPRQAHTGRPRGAARKIPTEAGSASPLRDRRSARACCRRSSGVRPPHTPSVSALAMA